MENLEERKPEINHDTPTKKRKIFSGDLKINNDSTSSTSSSAAYNEQCSATSADEVGAPCGARVEENNKSSGPSNDPGCGLPRRIGEAESPGSSSSEASESDWQPPTHGSIDWIHSQMLNGRDPRDIIYKLVPGLSSIPTHINNWDVWRLLVRVLSEPPRRVKLPDVNTFEDAIGLIRSCRKIMILTGAGVSVSCGIPDFRSRDGVYARLAVDFPDLPNPEAMFDITYFKHDPRPFFKFAKEIYPGQYKPSLIHRFISKLEEEDKLLRNYTQNIDTLEQVAGISRVIQCHGSFATASCQVCKHQVDSDAVREDIFNQVVPHCPRCPGPEPGILKPDIVFFGENLPDHFHRQMSADKDEADLLLVIGSALKVRPVALIPNSLPKEVPQILINREPLPHMSFDVELLGDGDVIVGEICRRLSGRYDGIHGNQGGLSQIVKLPDDGNVTSSSCDVSDEIKENVTLNNNEPDTWSSDDEKNASRSRPHSKSNPVKSDNNAADNSDVVESNNKTVDISGVVESNNGTDGISDPGEPKEEETSCNISMEENSDGKEADSSALWKSRWKRSISKRLPAETYYYDGGHRYIFPGAEVAPEEESDCSSSESSSSDTSDGEDSIVSSGISPMQRHYFPRRTNPLQPNTVTTSNDDVSASSFQSRAYRNEENEMREFSKEMVDIDLDSKPRTLDASEQPPHCYVEPTSMVTKDDALSSLESVDKVCKY